MNDLKEEVHLDKKYMLYNLIFITIICILMSCSLIAISINPYKITIVNSLLTKFNKEVLLLFFCSIFMINNMPESKEDFHLKTNIVLFFIMLDTSVFMFFSLIIDYLIKRIGG